jgi:prepilin-type N-terminal cleavage/methylation domain-containing protein
MKKNSSPGFTLIEMIIVVVILSTVSAISLHFLVNSLKAYSMAVNQKTLLDEGKLALERMGREVRDARSILFPPAGSSGNRMTLIRTHATAQDSGNENITFQLAGNTLVKVKTQPAATSAMAANVSAFIITREAASDEIKIELALSLGSGENVALQTKVYPKNLADSPWYKNFLASWQEEQSS